MDENVMRVLQMLQEGKITAQEAETLIAALRGESRAEAAPETKKEEENREDKSFGIHFEKIKTPKLDLDDLGERISKAVAKVQPEKIVKRVQAQLRTATRAGAHWGATVTARVRTWTDGDDMRPTNESGLPEHSETHDFEFHLDSGSEVFVENPLGDVKVTGISDGPAKVIVRKMVWNARSEDLKTTAEQMTVNIHGTDKRLDIKVAAPDFFHDGVLDLELTVPRDAAVRAGSHFGNIELTHLEGRAEATTTSGDLRCADLNGDLRGETASGDLHLERLGAATIASQSGDIHAKDIRRGLIANTASGDVHAENIEGGRVECKSVSGDVKAEHIGAQAPLDITVESVSGDATLNDASGNVAIKAVSGDVHADHIAATRLQAQTVSGDVQVGIREAFSGTMQINTVSGDVTLTLPEGSNLRVSLSTSSGELRCDDDAQNVVATDTLWTGQLGTGAGTLNVQTISGDTHIRRA